MCCYDVAETSCSRELKVANEAPSTVILFETPIAVGLIGKKSCYFDLATLLILMTAESSESGKLLGAKVAWVAGRLDCGVL